MNAPAKKRMGRPPGSKNKRKGLSKANLQTICEYKKFNPALFLIEVADGTDTSEEWSKEDRLKAGMKLFDAIHGKQPLAQVNLEGNDQGNVQLNFITADGDFALPGASGAEGDQGADGMPPIRDTGVPSPYGQDGFCDQ